MGQVAAAAKAYRSTAFSGQSTLCGSKVAKHLSAAGFQQCICKHCLLCGWLQGFLVNRVLIPMINEAFYCLMEVSTGAVGLLGKVWGLWDHILRPLCIAPPGVGVGAKVQVVPGCVAHTELLLSHQLMMQAMLVLCWSEFSLEVFTGSSSKQFLVLIFFLGVLPTWFCPVLQNVGTAEDIDKGMRLGTNQPMGPLRLADFIGGCMHNSTFCSTQCSGRPVSHCCFCTAI